MLSKAITPESVLLDIEAANFEDAIQLSAEPLKEQGYINQDYIDEIIRIYRQTGPYIVLTNQIALPHAPSTAGSEKVGLGFTRLKQPVVSGNRANDPVKFLFPLSAPDSSSHISLLSELADYLGDPSFIEFLGTVSSSKAFIDYLQKKEGVE